VERSPAPGATTVPLTAAFTYRRLSEPPMQRSPSPKWMGEARMALPCRTIALAEGSWPEDVSTSASGTSVPLHVSCAPPVAAELSQPRPHVPLFEHGQGTA